MGVSGIAANIWVLFKAKGLTRLKTRMNILSKTMVGTTKVANTMGRIFKSSLMGAGAAMGFAAYEAVKFETQMANVNTMLTDSTTKYLKGYSKGIKRMASEFGQSSATLSKGLYDILSASVDAGKAMKVLKASAIFAVAGMTDVSSAADAVTTVLNAYQMSADRATEITDKFFATVKRGKLTPEELASNIGKLASTAHIAGVSLNEMLAAVATMTRQGIKSERAMTAMLGMLRSFLKPSEKATAAAKKFGIELSTTNLKAKGLVGILQELKDASPEELAKMFPRIRGLKALAALISDISGFQKDANKMIFSGGQATKQYGKIAETASFQLKQLWEQIRNIFKAIGKQLLPKIKEWAKWTQHLGQAIENNDGSFLKMLTTVIKISLKMLALVVALKAVAGAIKMVDIVLMSTGWGALIKVAAMGVAAILVATGAFEKLAGVITNKVGDSLNSYKSKSEQASQIATKNVNKAKEAWEKLAASRNRYAELLYSKEKGDINAEGKKELKTLEKKLNSTMGKINFESFQKRLTKAVKDGIEHGLSAPNFEKKIKKINREERLKQIDQNIESAKGKLSRKNLRESLRNQFGSGELQQAIKDKSGWFGAGSEPARWWINDLVAENSNLTGRKKDDKVEEIMSELGKQAGTMDPKIIADLVGMLDLQEMTKQAATRRGSSSGEGRDLANMRSPIKKAITDVRTYNKSNVRSKALQAEIKQLEAERDKILQAEEDLLKAKHKASLKERKRLASLMLLEKKQSKEFDSILNAEPQSVYSKLFNDVYKKQLGLIMEKLETAWGKGNVTGIAKAKAKKEAKSRADQAVNKRAKDRIQKEINEVRDKKLAKIKPKQEAMKNLLDMMQAKLSPKAKREQKVEEIRAMFKQSGAKNPHEELVQALAGPKNKAGGKEFGLQSFWSNIQTSLMKPKDNADEVIKKYMPIMNDELEKINKSVKKINTEAKAG